MYPGEKEPLSTHRKARCWLEDHSDIEEAKGRPEGLGTPEEERVGARVLVAHHLRPDPSSVRTLLLKNQELTMGDRHK